LCFAAKMLETSALSCTKVFHSAQSGHCPCQRCWTDPQAWQVYRDFGFAIAGTIHEHRFRKRASSAAGQTSAKSPDMPRS
jgi:hypothetical protein